MWIIRLNFIIFSRKLTATTFSLPLFVEQIDGKMAPWNIPAEKWGDFLIAIFDEWVRNGVGNYFIQYFDATLAN